MGWCEKNPVIGIQRYPEEKRDRWLREEELNRLWDVLEPYPKSYSANVFKFLILTGACKGECLNAQWEHFDLEKGVWIKLSHLAKQKKREYLPISGKAV